jgi:hypothetical protein
MTANREGDQPAGPHDPDGVVIASLRGSCPSFEPKWRRLVAEWEPDLVPQYIAVGEFASHLVDELGGQSVDGFPVVFDQIEQLLHNDDPGIRYLLTWGLLEDLGNIAANTGGWPSARQFRRWFGRLTKMAWDEIHQSWGTETQDPPSRDIPEH